MAKKYYIIIKKYSSSSTSSFSFYFNNIYQGYLFRADEDGPTLMYDATYGNDEEAIKDLRNIAKSLNIADAKFLGICNEQTYNEIMGKLFKE